MIDIRNLNFSIAEMNILKNLDIVINDNEIVAIIGKNGSGKSTLLKCIASLNNYTGDIFYNGINLKTLKNKKRSQIISFLPQNCVKTNIKVQTLIRHGRFPHLHFGDKLSKNDNDIINCAIDTTKVSHIISKNVNEISGGERQLAYLTMILAQDTNVVLFDEPNTFLDIEHQIFLFDLIKHLKEKNKTVIVVLHDIIQALEIADRILVIDDGEKVDFDTAINVIPSIENVFNIKVAKVEKVNSDSEPLYKFCLLKS